MPSILPGKMGMDSIMLRLKFAEGESFRDYLEKGGTGINAQEKYSSIIYDLSDCLRDFLENGFKAKTHRGVLSLFEEPPPYESFDKIRVKLHLGGDKDEQLFADKRSAVI